MRAADRRRTIDGGPTHPHVARGSASMDNQPVPDRILDLSFAFFGSKALLSAVELGLFTELAEGPLDAETLRQRLDLHPRASRDFFDALVALGMLEREAGRYRNTAETDLYLDR